MDGQSFDDPPADEDLQHMKIFWEPVNVAALDFALGLSAVRIFQDFNLYEILHSVRVRAVSIRGVRGLIPVLMRPGAHAPGLPGRFFCGVGKVPEKKPENKKNGKKRGRDGEPEEEVDLRKIFIEALPGPIQREFKLNIADVLIGRSCFAFSKVVRIIARKDLNIVEVDAVNSFYQLLSKVYPVEPPIREYLDQRDATLDRLREHLGVSKAAAKKLMIALGFGGSFANWSSQTLGFIATEQDVKLGNVVKWFNDFQDAVSLLHMACWRGLSAAARKWHEDRGRSKASADFAIYANLESSRVLLPLSRAASKDLASLEHDGISCYEAAAERI